MTEQERQIVQRAQEKLRSRRRGNLAKPLPRVAGVPATKAASPRIGRGIGREMWMQDEGAFLSDFYSYLRRRVPILSNGLAAWVDLSTSGATVDLEGGSDLAQRRAIEALDALSHRVYEFSFCHGLGFQALMEIFFLSFYTNGRFAAEIVPFADLSGIAYVGLIDAFTIKFKRQGDRITLVQKTADDKEIPLPADRIFYAAFDPDEKHPAGVSLLDSVAWVVEIKEKMLEDMARSSHNAGYPRLRVSVTPPEALPGESASSWQGRANSDFDETVDAFRDLAVDDNVFVNSNVEVEVLSVNEREFGWSVNLEKVVEDVVSGLRLYAWVLGFSHGSTKNWVDAQHDLLMQRVQRGATQGARLLDWVRNTELALKGSPVRSAQGFEPLRDPGRLIQERAERFKFERVDGMVERGYISKDEGARMMGLRRAFRGDG